MKGVYIQSSQENYVHYGYTVQTVNDKKGCERRVAGLIPWAGRELLADVPLSKAFNPSFAPWAPNSSLLLVCSVPSCSSDGFYADQFQCVVHVYMCDLYTDKNGHSHDNSLP